MWLLAVAAASAGSSQALTQQALAGLPRALQERAAELHIEHGPAPSLPSELRTPHLLVQEGPRGLRVLADGLESQVEAWGQSQGVEADPHALAVVLLRRNLAHGLAHSLEREHPLSSQERWLALSDWGLLRPGEQDPLSFGGPGATASPREDLAAAVEHWATGQSLPGDPTLEAACRMRSKLDLIEASWGPAPAYQRCEQLRAAGLDDVEGLELLLVQASSQDPSSVGGHLMLGVRYAPDAQGFSRLETFTMIALTGAEQVGSAAYIAKGVAGGFPSVVRREPYRLSVLRYAQENRGIQRIPLDLDPQQLKRALERLDELQQAWSRPYLFFTRNCTQLPLEIVEAALQQSLDLPGFYTPDALIGAVQRRGLLAPSAGGQPSPQDRALRAQDLRLETEIALLATHPALREDLDRAQSRDFRERGAAYRALGAACTALDPEACETLRRYLLLSEDIERIALGGGVPVGAEHPLMVDLWEALAASGALTQGQAAVQVQGQLSSFPAARVPPSSSHAPLMRLELGVGLRRSPVGDAAALRLGTQLYRSRLGERRHHGLAEGVELAAFPIELLLAGADSSQSIQARGAVLEYHRLFAQRAALNPGLMLTVLPLSLSSDAPSSLSPVLLGGSVELVQSGGHRHHLLLYTGLSPMRLRWPSQEAAWGVGIPVALRGRLGSARHTLTALEVQASVTPFRGTQPGRIDALSVQGQRRLGELEGADLALSLELEVSRWEVGAATGQATTLTLGLWMERF